MRVCWPAVGWLLCGVAGVKAQAPTAAQLEFFEMKVRPVLAEHCYACHSTEAKKQKGGLRLDHRDALHKGGDSGPALVAGKPDESLLIKAIRYTHDDLKMPPKGKLPAAAIADLEAWVTMGAPDPREKATPIKAAQTWDEMLRTRRDWWSLQPVRKPAVPLAKSTSRSDHPVDRFVLAKLEQAGLQPTADADPRALIRRLSLVLTGLPPSTTEGEEFARDHASAKRKQDVVADWVDRLLRSPHFGERWARHWMDVVRFTETHGNEWNYDVHHAWRYRDYLIRAFNDDVPFDQLLREHIAGDLLAPRWNKADQFNEAPIGTAFYRFGEVNHDDCIGLPTLGYDILDNQIDTLTKAFQATTVACARCHDHKIDAVSMKDYYALLGILRSSRPVSHTIDAPEISANTIQRMKKLKEEIRRSLAPVWLEDVRPLHKERFDAIKSDKATFDDPLHLWRSLREEKDVEAAWRTLAAAFEAERQRRIEIRHRDYVELGGFHAPSFVGGHRDGAGLQVNWRGEFTIAAQGDRMIGSILPAGAYTHLISEKLNGALRSPILRASKKRISFHVIGEKQAAVRLVSNSCQLNYRNFRVLKSGQWHWITLDIPEEAESLHCYAELMTKFNNPKYPDQLGQLGGDDGNQRVPWEKAAADPHSYFGVTQILLHDTAQPPPADLSWLAPLYAGPAPKNLDELAARYQSCTQRALETWCTLPSKSTDAEALWLDWLLRHGLLSNSAKRNSTIAQLVEQFRSEDSRLPIPRIVPGLAQLDESLSQPIFIRGDCRKTGESVTPRYLEVLARTNDPYRYQGSRLQLANTIADPANPLTARVMVNRIWHHVFGHGIVRTCDDFGRMGDTPSHPELLDWLAARFVEDKWSVKKMIRLLATSQAFQMSARADAKANELDPLNRLLHHYPARRMEAEAIRDSILAVSGRLDRTMYGLSVLPYREKANEDRRLFPGPLDGNGRRSIYIKVNLMEGARFLSAFDLPGGKVTQGRRDVTNVPAQALALMNDPFVIQQAEVWAKKLVERKDETPAARIEHMFRAALGRPASLEERERFERFVEQTAQAQRISTSDAMSSVGVWQDVAHALFNVQEFIYIP